MAERCQLFWFIHYAYKYDSRNRLIRKKVPGKGWESMVYNQYDQLVATQDANQAIYYYWSYTKYDALGRVIMTGETVEEEADQASLSSIVSSGPLSQFGDP